jgi:biopolymer transport protein ExbD
MDQNQNSFSTYSSTPPQIPVQDTPIVDTMVPNTKPKRVGPIVAILVVVLIIVIAGIYLVSKQFEVVRPTNDTASLTPQSNTETQNIEQTDTNSAAVSATIAPISNTNDDLDSLQNDLDASLNGLDAQQI